MTDEFDEKVKEIDDFLHNLGDHETRDHLRHLDEYHKKRIND